MFTAQVTISPSRNLEGMAVYLVTCEIPGADDPDSRHTLSVVTDFDYAFETARQMLET